MDFFLQKKPSAGNRKFLPEFANNPPKVYSWDKFPATVFFCWLKTEKQERYMEIMKFVFSKWTLNFRSSFCFLASKNSKKMKIFKMNKMIPGVFFLSTGIKLDKVLFIKSHKEYSKQMAHVINFSKNAQIWIKNGAKRHV